ncbi:unnamed protein product [Effrenium voratum]|nr:unnamed protein product [Effrenium voratum]
MSQADAAGGASIITRQGTLALEAKKPFLPLRALTKDRPGGPEDGGGPPKREAGDVKGAVQADPEDFAESLLRSLAEEPYETVFEDPPAGCACIKNLDTGEARPLAPGSCTASFVGKQMEPSRLQKRPWRLWWSEKRRKDDRLLQAAAEGDVDTMQDLLTQSKAQPFASCGAFDKASGRHALHFAVGAESMEALELLLDHGAQVNIKSRSRATALHVAAARGHVGMVLRLLAAGADAMCQTEEGQTALHLAAANGRSEAIKALLQQEPEKQLVVRNKLGQLPPQSSADALTAFMFRGFAFASCGVGSRRNSACSEVSTAASSTDLGDLSDLGYGIGAAVDTYLERTAHATGALRRDSRADAVQRLLRTTRKLKEVELPERHLTEKTLTAMSFKAASPKGSPSKSPSASSGTSTPKRPNLVKMKSGSSRVEKVGPNSFELVKLLGRGSFGEVFQVRHKRNSKVYAMKVLQKSRIMSSNLLRYAVTERNILAYIRHPYIVSLHYAFQTPSHLVLVLQYCPRGNLQQLITREKRLGDELSRLYTAEILLALIHLHERHTVFRDLKPDNVVIDEEHHALLTDFGLSKEGVGQRGTKSFCGSVAFLAPEILLRKGHNHTVDIYNLGVLLYDMLTGLPPFYHHDRETLFANIKHARLEVPLYVSRPARAFIEATMEREPGKRLGAHHTSEVKNHAFFAETDFEQIMRREVPVPEAHPADESSIPWLTGPLGMAKAPESPFAPTGWRKKYAKIPVPTGDRGVSGWDFASVNTRSVSQAPSSNMDSESSTSTRRPMGRRASSASSREDVKP